MSIDKKTLRRVFLGVMACIVLYWLLHETDRVRSVWRFITNMLSPFVVGAAIAFIINVPMRGIERCLQKIRSLALRRTLAIVLTFASISLVLYLVVCLLIPQITDTIGTLIETLPVFFENLYEQGEAFVGGHPEMMEWIYSNTDLESFDWSSLLEKVMAFVGDSVSTIWSGVLKTIGNLSTGIFNGVISLVFAVYSLVRKEVLARQARRLLYAFLPEKFCDSVIKIFRLTNKTFSNFISGQCLEALILGSMFAISMLIFGMPYIPLVSVLIAVTALVPIVGAFVGCILGAFFILVNDPMQAVWFVIMFLVLQQIEGNLIYPKVVGSSVGLPGMWVLLAVSVGGELMGVGGMLLMIPLTSVLYTILRELTKMRLEQRGIDKDKLREYPPELRNRLVRSRKRAKEKNASQTEAQPEKEEE